MKLDVHLPSCFRSDRGAVKEVPCSFYFMFYVYISVVYIFMFIVYILNVLYVHIYSIYLM